jgi:hypothetical protein
MQATHFPKYAAFAALLLAFPLFADDGQGRPSRRQPIATTPSADFFVAVDGSDSWSGTLATPNAGRTDGPFASVARAQNAIRSLVRTNPGRPLTIMLREGTYYLALSPTSPGTLNFTAADSGTLKMPITWVNYPGETPIISGGVPIGQAGLGLTWTNVSGSLWQVTLPAGTQPFEYLFYNGARRLRSRLQSASGTGYYMRGGVCYDTVAKAATATGKCNLGTYLRVANTVAPSDPQGAGCPNVTSTTDSTQAKCLDRFEYNPSDPVAAWQNLNPTAVKAQTCTLAPNNSYPQGDVELLHIDAWTEDLMRVSCVDTVNHIVYLTGPMKGMPSSYQFFGPQTGHRYIVENAKDAFEAAQNAGQTGLWFLDRSKSTPVLNYLANSGENPNTDNVVIGQLQPVSTLGGSLISATGLNYVTFRGITFEVDNYLPPAIGFNTDEHSDDVLPEAIDCESCQNVTFDGVTVRHTSTAGILIASIPGNSGAPASNDVVENSAFYDIGDVGVRIGHHPNGNDKSPYVTQFITVQNNIIQGYSRVFPSAGGLVAASGHDLSFLHNDINDGYHMGLSVCEQGCQGNPVNGSNVLSAYNHIWNVMQGVTSDSGTLYYNVGNPNSSGTGNKILNNLVHDATDSSIIDGKACGGQKCSGEGYGGNGIYLDDASGGVDVENNVVYHMSDSGLSIAGPAPGQAPNNFNNNIVALALNSMFFQPYPWPDGCVSLSVRANLTNNIFYFDQSDSDNFYTTEGCAYSCGLNYNQFQNFENNLWWRTDGKFNSYTKAFHVLTSAPADVASSCLGSPKDWTFLTFAQWQGGKPPNGIPGAMDEDAGSTASVNPGFGSTGQPSDFLLSSNPISGFDYTKTNDTILHAGRNNPVIMPPVVPATFPSYTYTSF